MIKNYFNKILFISTISIISIFVLCVVPINAKADTGTLITPKILDEDGTCHANIETTTSVTENRSWYISLPWIGGNAQWDDFIAFSIDMNGGEALTYGQRGNWACTTQGSVDSGYVGQNYIFSYNSGDTDTFTFHIVAYQTRDAGSSGNKYWGQVEYGYTKNLCAAGQFTSNNSCVDTSGTLGVGLGGSGQSNSSLSCTSTTAGCTNPEVHWRTNSGLGGRVLRDGSLISSAADGDMIDSGANLVDGEHSYVLQIQDGFGNWYTKATATVTVSTPAMSGTLTPASASCEIGAGAATCNVTLTWSTTNPVGTSHVTAPTSAYAPAVDVSGNSGSQSFVVPAGGRTFYLYNNNQQLDTSTTTSTCVTGTTWDGNTCVAPPAAKTATLSVSALQIALSSTRTSDSSIQISNNNSTNGGSFDVFCDITTPMTGLTASSITCPASLASGANGNLSVTLNPTPSTASNGVIRVRAVGTGSPTTTVSGSPKDVTETYTPPNVMSGTLTSSSTSCEIYSGASTCNVTLTWSTTNPEATSAVTAAASPYAPAVNVSGNSGSQSFAVPYNSRTFYLYNNSKSLVPTSPNGTGVTITSSCVAGTTWTSGACITTTAPPSPTCPSGQTGTPPNCTTPPTSGSVTLTANPNSGPAPLNGVSLRAAVGDSAGWKYYYYFFCNAPNPVAVPPGGSNPPFNNDGGSVTYTSSTTANSSNNCNYSSAGTYTGRVAVLKYQGSDPFTTNYWQNSSNWRQATAAVTATTPVSPIPVSLTANPPSMTLPTNSTILTWTTTGNPTSCIASNGWSGAKTASGGTENRTGLTAQTYTYNITCSKSGVPDVIDTATVVVTAPVMSCTLAPTNPPGLSSCIIASGASACNINFSWTTTNPVSTSSVTRNPSSGFNPPLQNSGTNVPFPVPYNTATFFLYNNNTELAQSAVTASCVSGTTWDGSKCDVPLPAAPSNLQASNAICGAIRLTWQDNSNNETGFRIYRSRSQSFSIGGYYATVGANVTSYTDPTVA